MLCSCVCAVGLCVLSCNNLCVVMTMDSNECTIVEHILLNKSRNCVRAWSTVKSDFFSSMSVLGVFSFSFSR